MHDNNSNNSRIIINVNEPYFGKNGSIHIRVQIVFLFEISHRPNYQDLDDNAVKK